MKAIVIDTHKRIPGTITTYKGGIGSGNFGHAGRPGEVGGSQISFSMHDITKEIEDHIKYHFGRKITDIRSFTSSEIGAIQKSLREFKTEFANVPEINNVKFMALGLDRKFNNAELFVEGSIPIHSQDIDAMRKLPHVVILYANEVALTRIVQGGEHIDATFNGIIEHELGHSLFNRLPKDMNRKWSDLWIVERIRSDNGRESFLSKRGLYNLSEGFAEVIAHHIGGGKLPDKFEDFIKSIKE